jgi:BRCT domain type II-containing protein
MPRAKKKTTTFKKSASRKTTPRRKTSDRRRSEPGDIFRTKVINGFKKFLESPFK